MNIETIYSFKDNKNITFTLVFPSLDIIKICGDIIWDKKSDNNKYSYGIKIIKLTDENEAAYISFINNLEIYQ
ncbi:hypothetical protein EW093_02110 [Thiospirochaeta perfilievii]|uniref:Uncharacterized protein n=1 Tax=Thiospirochaeta perfilievii TaxID=252967 RepID=A0A5C1QBI2_9SPIO|nr:hypothetical protein [Thiospirochaeta perfilievii]QEN03542.1 hypothetical protein EW093_02110 [Thiospirochaeta perfilievii]